MRKALWMQEHRKEYRLVLMRFVKLFLFRTFSSWADVTASFAMPVLFTIPLAFLFSCVILWISNVMCKQNEQAYHNARRLSDTSHNWGSNRCFHSFFGISETPVSQYLLPLTLRWIRPIQHNTSWLWSNSFTPTDCLNATSLLWWCGNWITGVKQSYERFTSILWVWICVLQFHV